MKKITCKFGGTSLAHAEAIRKAQSIVDADPARRYIVPSAPGKRGPEDRKITDLLYSWHSIARQGLDPSQPRKMVEDRYVELAKALGVQFDVQAELDQQLFRKLTEGLPRALGTTPGSEANADAEVRGRIVRYEDVAQNYRATSGQQTGVDVLTHQVQITVAIEIVDRKRNVILWDSQSVVGRGEYRIDSERDSDAREKALNHILQQIIDGAQSQW